jgi:hypothetical protein
MTKRPNADDPPSLLALATSDGVPKSALIAGLVVGTILNLINQGDALWRGGELDVVKMGLTYIVPYCVATYGAVSARRRFVKAAADAD